MRKRNHSIITRMDDAEYDELQDKVSASGLTQQSYIINSALKGKVSSAEEVAEMKRKASVLEDYDRQLRGMATNLNQLAHIANGYGEVPDVETLMQILSEVQSLRKEVNTEWQSTRRSISQQRVTEQ